MPTPPRLLASIAAISLALVAPARAQSPEAESLFEQGDALMNQGKLAEACDAFDASNKIEARAGTLIRLGDCREKNHQIASAWSAYKDALTRVKDEKKKQIATDKVASLAPRLSYLRINVANPIAGLEITRAGHVLAPAEWNHPLPIDGGTYAISVRAPGYSTWTSSVVVPDEHGQIVVDVPALAVDKTATTSVAVPGKLPPPPPSESSSWTGKRKAAVAMAGVAVLAGVGGIVLGNMAKGKQDDADKLCPGMICPQPGDVMTATNAIHDGQSLALDANIAFGVAGAAAITAGILWFTGAPEHQAVAISASHGTTVLTISGRF